MNTGVPMWLVPPALVVDEGLARLYLALLAIGAAIAIISLATQMRAPAPYGRHARTGKDGAWGPPIPQRAAHTLSDAIPGVLLFGWLFFATAGALGVAPPATSWILFGLWMLHFVHRGLIHPWTMRYSSRSTPVGICLGALVPNAIFATLNALALTAMLYPADWMSDPRFLVGCVTFLAGWGVNRRADWTLRGLREPGETAYRIPRGGLFEHITCPNYFGELLMWVGWAVATWSAAGAVFALFAAATFIPRARDHHAWYQENFPEYPESRRRLVPMIW